MKGYSDHWPAELVIERWESLTMDEREALMRFGWKKAPWESTPDTAQRLLKCDPKISLTNGISVMAIFRTAYEHVALPEGADLGDF